MVALICRLAAKRAGRVARLTAIAVPPEDPHPAEGPVIGEPGSPRATNPRHGGASSRVRQSPRAARPTR